MKWTMTIACSNCPFRKQGGIPLTRDRIKEISRTMLDSQGGTFPCHKTVEYDEDDEPMRSPNQVHCAGALAYAMKQGTLPQVSRMMSRVGSEMDCDAIERESGPVVWDSEAQWLRSKKAVAR